MLPSMPGDPLFAHNLMVLNAVLKVSTFGTKLSIMSVTRGPRTLVPLRGFYST